MDRNSTLILISIPAALLSLGSIAPKDDGYMPSGTGSSTSMTRKGNDTCGKCHGGSSSLSGTTVDVIPTARVLDAGQTIGIKVAASAAVVSNTGGFAADISRGSLIAGSNSRIRGDALAITHRNDRSRSWSFSYKAPSTPGLVEFYTVAMAADGDGNDDRDDRFGFFGSNPSNTISTPVRFYVNAPGVKAIGESCDDGYGNHSVLGSPTTPKVGSAFTLEAHGLPPASQALLLLDVGKTIPGGFDMAPMGAPGCVLYTAASLDVGLPTSSGNAQRSEGKLVLPTTIPNDPNLRGVVISLQVLALDKKPKRTLPLIATNALELTIQ